MYVHALYVCWYTLPLKKPIPIMFEGATTHYQTLQT